MRIWALSGDHRCFVSARVFLHDKPSFIMLSFDETNLMVAIDITSLVTSLIFLSNISSIVMCGYLVLTYSVPSCFCKYNITRISINK